MADVPNPPASSTRKFDPDGPLDEAAADLLKQLHQRNSSLVKHRYGEIPIGISELESDTLSTESIQAQDAWLGAESNVYLKTDEAKAFKRLLTKGIEVLAEAISMFFSRELQLRVLHANPDGTLLVISELGKGQNILNQRVFPFSDIMALPKGEKQIQIKTTSHSRSTLIQMTSRIARNLFIRYIGRVSGNPFVEDRIDGRLVNKNKVNTTVTDSPPMVRAAVKGPPISLGGLDVEIEGMAGASTKGPIAMGALDDEIKEMDHEAKKSDRVQNQQSQHYLIATCKPSTKTYHF